jgi:hypothetical protein
VAGACRLHILEASSLVPTTDWTSCETRFFLKKGQLAYLVMLNLVVEGSGEKIEVKDVELWKTPL